MATFNISGFELASGNYRASVNLKSLKDSNPGIAIDVPPMPVGQGKTFSIDMPDGVDTLTPDNADQARIWVDAGGFVEKDRVSFMKRATIETPEGEQVDLLVIGRGPALLMVVPLNGDRTAVLNTYLPSGNYKFISGDEPVDFSVALAPVVEPQAPIAADDTATTDEDTAIQVDVLANDSDPDGDDSALQLLSPQTDGPAQVQVVDGKIEVTPDANFFGEIKVTYTIRDGDNLTDEGELVVTVDAVNDDPIANDDQATTGEDTPVTVDVLANDTDVDNDTLTLDRVEGSVGGSARIEDGKVVFTPNAEFSGEGRFQYFISDGNGGSSSARAFVTVEAYDDAPNAGDDIANVKAGEQVVIDVLANDTDVDTPVDQLSLVSVDAPAGGTAQIIDGKIVYTAAQGTRGVDRFDYRMTDGTSTVSATVTVTVSDPDPVAPVAVDDSFTIAEDGSALFNVTANDFDPDGGDLTLVSVTGATLGQARVENGQLRYTPAADASGSDSLSYTIRDADGLTAEGQVTMTVTPVNDAPQFTSADSFTVEENGTVVGTVQATDVDSGTLTYGLGTVGDSALFDIDPTTGALSFKTAPDFETPADGDGDNVYQAQVTVTDGTATSSQTVSVTVTDVAEGIVYNPVQGDDTAQQLSGTDGADRIVSGGGTDAMFGLGGADEFVIEFNDGNGRELPTIADYDPTQDTIDIGAHKIAAYYELGTLVMIRFEGDDADTLFVHGTGSFDDIQFV